MDKKLELELIQEIDPDQLTESQQLLFHELGREKFIALCRGAGGNSFYIPKIEDVIKKTIYNRIEKEFDGTNIHSITVKYGISKTKVYQIARDRNKNI